MATSVDLAQAQQLAVEALIGSGAFRTRSELLRSAIEDFLRHIPKSTRLAAAVWAYGQRKASLSQAAALADVTHEEMHRTLVREGVFRSGATAQAIRSESDFLTRNAKVRARPKKTR